MAVTSVTQTSRPPAGPLGQTDPTRWRLDTSDNGRHVWHYLREANSVAYEELWGEDTAGVKTREQTVETKYELGLPLPPVSGLVSPDGNPYKAAAKGKLACNISFDQTKKYRTDRSLD